ncbi:MAG: cysteine desulfurase [Zetaproteobacteria bacterium]|nr:MAG: cysteine desulfurase [Zetaproteobacteria bacterium]
MNIEQIRAQFPALQQQAHGHPLAYLDNAATTQKPQCVIDAVRRYYEQDNANIHRGVHMLSERATAAYEGVRVSIADFFHAGDPCEVIFTRGATEAINLVAASWGAANLRAGDEILLSAMEHHSNIVPWQMVARRTGAVIRVLPMDGRGALCMEQLDALLTERTRLVGVVQMSNALGTVNPVAEIIERAHAVGAVVLVDGAQSAAHMPIDLQALGADFFVTSAHKMYGPTGIGVLIGRRALLEEMPPWQGGGDMIRTVRFQESSYAPLPHKFEAGTPNIAGVIGFGAAIDWLSAIGFPAIAEAERTLLAYATERAMAFDGLRIIGTAPHKACVLSFVLDGVHPHDLGTILDSEGVAIRAGHHCAMPVMEHFGLPATARASLAIYNTRAEIDALFCALKKARALFG